MNDKLSFYFQSQLLGSGIAVVDPTLAQTLSCQLWPTMAMASMDFQDLPAIIRCYGQGCHVLTAQCEERDVILLIRTNVTTKLAERLESLTGLVFTKLKIIDAQTLQPVKEQPPEFIDHDTQMEKLREERARLIAQQAEELEEYRRSQFEEKQRHQQWLEDQRRADDQSWKQHFAPKERVNA